MQQRHVQCHLKADAVGLNLSLSLVMAKDRKSSNVQMQPHYELLLRPQSVIQSLLNQSFSTQWPSFALKATGSLNIEH